MEFIGTTSKFQSWSWQLSSCSFDALAFTSILIHKHRYHGASLPRKDFWWGVKYAKVARPNNAMGSNAERRRWQPGLQARKHDLCLCMIASVNMSHARNAHSIQRYLSSSTKLVLVVFEQMCCSVSDFIRFPYALRNLANSRKCTCIRVT